MIGASAQPTFSADGMKTECTADPAFVHTRSQDREIRRVKHRVRRAADDRQHHHGFIGTDQAIADDSGAQGTGRQDQRPSGTDLVHQHADRGLGHRTHDAEHADQQTQLQVAVAVMIDHEHKQGRQHELIEMAAEMRRRYQANHACVLAERSGGGGGSGH